MKNKTVLTIATAAMISAAIISAQSPAQASINPTPIEIGVTKISATLGTLDIGYELEKTVAQTQSATPVLVAWSIKGAAKKVAKGVRKANRVVVPSEIRNAASKAKRGVYKAGRFVKDHPYGRRCKPGKYLQPICTVKPKGPKKVRTHRTNAVTYDHRTNTVTHDHRTKKVHDHRTATTN